MANSDFCLSPLGQAEGDSDRYLPALLYGCIPVFVCEDEVLPFDELLPWARFSLQLRIRDVKNLHVLLRSVEQARVVAMRRAMATVWPRLLWTTDNFDMRSSAGNVNTRMDGYLGESGGRDAFAMLMAVLSLRLEA